MTSGAGEILFSRAPGPGGRGGQTPPRVAYAIRPARLPSARDGGPDFVCPTLAPGGEMTADRSTGADGGRPRRRPGRRASYREGVSFGALTFLSIAALGVVSSVVIARLYGVEVIGQAALALAPGFAVHTLGSINEQAALVRRLAVLEARDPKITGLLLAVLTFSTSLMLVSLAIVGAVSYYLLTGPIGQPELVLPSLVFMVSFTAIGNVGLNCDTVFRSFRAGRQLFYIRLFEALSYFAIAVGVGIFVDSVWGIIAATVGAQLIALIHRQWWLWDFMRFIVPLSTIRDGFSVLPSLIVFGLKLGPGRIADGINEQLGTWVLGATVSTASVGAWNRAMQLGNRFTNSTNRVNEMLLPTLVERREEGDTSGYDRSLVDSMRYSSIALLLPAAVGGGAAYGVMDLFGPGFSAAADALALVLLVPAATASVRLLGTTLMAEDRPGLLTIVAIVKFVVTIALTLALAIALGITGAGLALLIGALLQMAMLIVISQRNLAVSFLSIWPPREILAVVVAYGVGFVVARVVDLQFAGTVGLLLALVIGTVVYGGAFVVLGGANRRDRERFRDITSRRRRRRAERTREDEFELASEALSPIDFEGEGDGAMDREPDMSAPRPPTTALTGIWWLVIGVVTALTGVTLAWATGVLG